VKVNFRRDVSSRDICVPNTPTMCVPNMPTMCKYLCEDVKVYVSTMVIALNAICAYCTVYIYVCIWKYISVDICDVVDNTCVC